MQSENGTANLPKAIWAENVAALRTAYPAKGFLETKESIALWYKMLCDLPGEQVDEAVKRYIMEEHFPPTIADIRKRCVARQAAALPEWEQGWGEVMNAIHRWGYLRESEALASLNPLTAEVVKNLGWQALCASENPEGDRIAFREVHNRYTAQARQNLQLTSDLRVQWYKTLTNVSESKIEGIQSITEHIVSGERTEGYAEAVAKRIAERIGNVEDLENEV